MFCYILGNDNKVVSSVSIDEEAAENPEIVNSLISFYKSSFDAVVDSREFAVGETWYPDEVEYEHELE